MMPLPIFLSVYENLVEMEEFVLCSLCARDAYILCARRSRPQIDAIGLLILVGIAPFKGEFVSALISVIPKRGMVYHQLVNPCLERVDCSLPYDQRQKYISDDERQALKLIDCRLNNWEYYPMLYDPEVLDTTEMFGDLGRVRIYRGKNGAGVFMPVSCNWAVAFYDSWDRDEKYQCSGGLRRWFRCETIANEEYSERHNGVACPISAKMISDEANNAIVAYNKHVGNVTNAYLEIRKAVKEFKELEERNNSRPDEDFYWVSRNAQKEYDEAKSNYDKAVRNARIPLNEALKLTIPPYDYNYKLHLNT